MTFKVWTQLQPLPEKQPLFFCPVQWFEQVAYGGLSHGADPDKRNTGGQLRSEEVSKGPKYAETALNPANLWHSTYHFELHRFNKDYRPLKSKELRVR